MVGKAKSDTKNELKVSKSRDNGVEIDGRFEHKSVECRLSGSWDQTGNAQGLRLVLSSKGRPVIDQVISFGEGSMSSHCKFGSAVEGIKEIQLLIEQARNATFVSGWADGRALIPARFEALPCCASCAEEVEPLRYASDGQIVAVNYELRNKQTAKDAAALAAAIENSVTAYRASRAPIIDDITDIVIGAYCYIRCSLEFLICLARLPFAGCQQLFWFCVATCKVVNKPMPF